MLQNYTVNQTVVGPWPKGHTFSEEEFRRLHKLPDNEQTRYDGLTEQGETAYQDDLLRRLLDNKAIVAADPAAKPMPTPVGPENRRSAPIRNTAAVSEKKADSVKELAVAKK